MKTITIKNNIFAETIIDNDIFKYEIVSKFSPGFINYDFSKRIIRWVGTLNQFTSDDILRSYFLHEFCHCYQLFTSNQLHRLTLSNYGYKNTLKVSYKAFRTESTVLALQKFLLKQYTSDKMNLGIPERGLTWLWERVKNKPCKNIENITFFPSI